MRESTNQCAEFCVADKVHVTNTMFRKPLEKREHMGQRKEIDGITNEPMSADTHKN